MGYSAAIPLGGYVKMLDEREGEVARTSFAGRSTADSGQAQFDRRRGPLANFVLAMLLYWAVLWWQPGVATGLGSAAGRYASGYCRAQ
jgi:membrane-associated protease RseP (regulator of RpoE activity)